MRPDMIEKWLGRSRFLVIFGVLGCLVLATLLFVYGFYHSLELAVSVAQNGIAGKKMVVAAIELVDAFLLATAFYLISLGLYELFISPDIAVPKWLEIRSFDDLKKKLINVVVTVLAVLFLAQIVAWDGQRELLGYGASIALVIVALTYFTRK